MGTYNGTFYYTSPDSRVVATFSNRQNTDVSCANKGCRSRPSYETLDFIAAATPTGVPVKVDTTDGANLTITTTTPISATSLGTNETAKITLTFNVLLSGDTVTFAPGTATASFSLPGKYRESDCGSCNSRTFSAGKDFTLFPNTTLTLTSSDGRSFTMPQTLIYGGAGSVKVTLT